MLLRVTSLQQYVKCKEYIKHCVESGFKNFLGLQPIVCQVRACARIWPPFGAIRSPTKQHLKSRGILTAVVIVTVRYFPKKTCFFNPPPLATEEQYTAQHCDRAQAPSGGSGNLNPSRTAKWFTITIPRAALSRHKAVCSRWYRRLEWLWAMCWSTLVLRSHAHRAKKAKFWFSLHSV